jgi:hypothetical protein
MSAPEQRREGGAQRTAVELKLCGGFMVTMRRQQRRQRPVLSHRRGIDRHRAHRGACESLSLAVASLAGTVIGVAILETYQACLNSLRG